MIGGYPDTLILPTAMSSLHAVAQADISAFMRLGFDDGPLPAIDGAAADIFTYDPAGRLIDADVAGVIRAYETVPSVGCWDPATTARMNT